MAVQTATAPAIRALEKSYQQPGLGAKGPRTGFRGRLGLSAVGPLKALPARSGVEKVSRPLGWPVSVLFGSLPGRAVPAGHATIRPDLPLSGHRRVSSTSLHFALRRSRLPGKNGCHD